MITDAQVEAAEAVIEGECNGLAIDRNILRQALEAAERARFSQSADEIGEQFGKLLDAQFARPSSIPLPPEGK